MILTHINMYKFFRLLQQNSQNLTMIITDSRMTDLQCYNVPTTSEIAAIIVGDNNNPSNVSNCDIILHSHEGGLHCISELHRAYVLLHYVLLFPEGRWMASNNSNPNLR